MKRLSADSRIEQVLKRIRSASVALAGLRVAERGEHALHPLGVVLVHLAPEGRHVEALVAPRRSSHRRSRVAARRPRGGARCRRPTGLGAGGSRRR